MCFDSSNSTHATPHEGGEERPEQEAAERKEEEEDVLGADVVTDANGDHSPCSQQDLTLPRTLRQSSQNTLSYPQVPPPSLFSSFGSPSVSYHMSHKDPPVEPFGRGASDRHGTFECRLPDSGNYRTYSQSHSRRERRGAREWQNLECSSREGRAGSQSITTLVVIC